VPFATLNCASFRHALLVFALTVGTASADQHAHRVPTSLHTFMNRLVTDARSQRDLHLSAVQQCYVDLADFYNTAYRTTEGLTDFYKVAIDRVAHLQPSTDRSRLIACWYEILASHSFVRPIALPTNIIETDPFWRQMVEEGKRGKDTPFTEAFLRNRLTSCNDAYKHTHVFPLGKLVDLIANSAPKMDDSLPALAKPGASVAERIAIISSIHFRIVMELIAITHLQRSQEDEENITTAPYADVRALSHALNVNISDQSPTYLARVYAANLASAVAVRDLFLARQMIMRARGVKDLGSNANAETHAYLRIMTQLTEVWYLSNTSDYRNALFDALAIPIQVEKDLSGKDRDTARSLWAFLRSQLQLAHRNYDGALQTLSSAIPRTLSAQDGQVLDLLALEAQVQSEKGNFLAAHKLIEKAKGLFETLAPLNRNSGRSRRAGILLAELVVLLNEKRVADMKPLVKEALNVGFSTHYASAIHYIAAKDLSPSAGDLVFVRYNLEEADRLLEDVASKEHIYVLTDLLKCVLRQGDKPEALRIATKLIELHETMVDLARGTEVYWAELFSRDYSTTESGAIELLVEEYLAKRDGQVLATLLWANEIFRSRGVQDGIKASWIGFGSHDPWSPNRAADNLLKRLFPPIPKPADLTAHITKTIGGLDLATERHNVFLIYVPSKATNRLLLVVCTSAEVSAVLLETPLSDIDLATTRVVEMQTRLLNEYQSMLSRGGRRVDADKVAAQEPELLKALTSLGRMLLPDRIATQYFHEPDKVGLTVVTSGKLQTVPFLALRIKQGGSLSYVRDQVAAFSAAPSVHCVYLLVYYETLFATTNVPQKGNAPPTRHLLSASDPSLDRSREDKAGIDGTLQQGDTPISVSNRDDFLSAIERSDGIHIFAHGVTSWDQPLLSGVSLGGSTVAIRDLLDPIRRMRHGDGLVTLAVCHGGERREVVGIDGWSFATAFFHVKCSAVVAPLWELDMAYAAKFFPALYRHTNSGTDSARAVVLTMRELAMDASAPGRQPGLLGYGSPCFWSSIVHFGW
jgi:hypothetical protein